MNINLTFDQAANMLPAGFVASINAVVQFYDTHYDNPITVNIDVGYGEIDGSPLQPGALGESETFLNEYSYSALRSALIANATSPDQIAAVNSLPASDPTPGGTGNYWLATAEAKAVGLTGASSATDGFIGFSNTNSFTYNTANGGSVAPGTFDFFGIAAHEISEVLGRALLVGGTVFTDTGNVNNSWEPLDLFHYSANGVRDFSGNTRGYFSPDGGATNVDNFNTNPNGDFGDWASSAGNDAFLAFSPAGVANPVTTADLREMNVLGYDEPPPPPLGFVGDFNGDTHSDLLWQASNGHPTMWLMNGTTITTSQSLANPGPTWHAIATGDFNNDGKSDILWQNADGLPAIWEMNGTSISTAAVLADPGPTWHAIATGDFNGDGKSDILWQNADGTPSIWEMNGTSAIGGAGVAMPHPGPTWHAITTGDFDGDGKADILWQNADGLPAIWLMNGTSIKSAAVLPNPTPAWHAVATADFNGDGNADIIWQNADGTPAIWEMNGTSIIGTAVLTNPGASWELIGAGNYNSLHPDLVFLNTSNDQVQIWVMNGTNVASMQTIATTAPSTAQPAVSAATPLSASPVLSQPDAFYASLAGNSGAFHADGGAATKPLFAAT
jgi:hypothetical protein